MDLNFNSFNFKNLWNLAKYKFLNSLKMTQLPKHVGVNFIQTENFVISWL